MKQRITLLILSLVMFMENLDTTIINTAIPTMARSLHVSPVDLKIALISYLLSLAICIPISGWMADRFGSKRVFLYASALFTLSSIWCGFTQNLTQLVIARCLQGIGGSFAMPVGRLVVLQTFPRHQIISKMNQIIMIGVLGVLVGPTVGGYITDYWYWPWIFWVNVPIGILVLILGLPCMISIPPKKIHPLDKIGFLLFGGSLASFIFALSALSESNLPINSTVAVLLLGVLLLVAYLWHSKNHPHPIVHTALLKIRSFRVATLGNLLTRLSFGGIPFLIPLFLQIGLQYPARTSGLLMAPIALGVVAMKPCSQWILRTLGYRRYLFINTVILGISISAFVSINAQTSIWLIAFFVFVFGSLLSLQFTGMNSLAYADIVPENFSSATSIMATLQQLSVSLGVAVTALLLHSFAVKHYHQVVLTIPVFHFTFLFLSIITILCGFIFTLLRAEDGQNLLESANHPNNSEPEQNAQKHTAQDDLLKQNNQAH